MKFKAGMFVFTTSMPSDSRGCRGRSQRFSRSSTALTTWRTKTSLVSTKDRLGERTADIARTAAEEAAERLARIVESATDTVDRGLAAAQDAIASDGRSVLKVRTVRFRRSSPDAPGYSSIRSRGMATAACRIAICVSGSRSGWTPHLDKASWGAPLPRRV